MYKSSIKEKHPLIDLTTYGSRSRKKIHSDVLIGEHPIDSLFKEGDILDANATLNLVCSTNDCIRCHEKELENTLDDHVSNNEIHITQKERDLWNLHSISLADWNETDELSNSYIKNKPELKDLAFKDSAFGSYTPEGTNESSVVNITDGETSNLVTTSIVCVSGVDSTHDTPTLNTEQISSIASWNAGSVSLFVYDEDGESLQFVVGVIPQLTIASKNVGTSITQGVEKIFAKSADSAITVATGQTSSNGSGATVATSLPTTGIAEALIFTGNEAIITVS